MRIYAEIMKLLLRVFVKISLILTFTILFYLKKIRNKLRLIACIYMVNSVVFLLVMGFNFTIYIYYIYIYSHNSTSKVTLR